jgi:hypothetical protein
LQTYYFGELKDGKRRLHDPKGIHYLIVKRIEKLKASEPAWFICGWHVPKYEADVAYWRAYSRCSVVQLTLLSVGLDPGMVGYNALFKRYGQSEDTNKMFHFIEKTNTKQWQMVLGSNRKIQKQMSTSRNSIIGLRIREVQPSVSISGKKVR